MDQDDKQPTPKPDRCPQCGAPRGEYHKMSCTEPGSSKGRKPYRPFGEDA